MHNLIIVGAGEPLARAVRLVKEATVSFTANAAEMTAQDDFNFELPDMEAYPRGDWQAFVALDARGLNMARLRVVSQLKGIGYRLARIVSRDAAVSDTTSIGENTIIDRFARVAADATVGLNTIISENATVATCARIGSSNFIGPGSKIERGVTTGDYVTIGADVVVAEGASVGKYSELAHKMTYHGVIPARTFYIPGFQNPTRIINPY